MRVHVLSALTYKAHSFTFPLRRFRKEMLRRGFDVRIFTRACNKLYEADVVCLTSEAFVKRQRLRIQHLEDKLQLVKRIRDRVDRLIWFDTSAGSGTTSFQVLPYVDVYAKNQALRDLSLYTDTYHGSRYVGQYYADHFPDIDRPKIGDRSPADPALLSKIQVSWNLGLGDFSSFAPWRRRWRVLRRASWYRPRYGQPTGTREIDFSFRGSTKFDVPALTFHREETCRRLEIFAKEHASVGIWAGRIKSSSYREELLRTKIIASPFGSGEVCFRDFECFVSGAALFKPRMDHLVTWPAYYVEGVTYQPYAWDFSDFEERLRELIEQPDLRIEVAKNGQEVFRHSIGHQGAVAFAEHFQELLTA